MKNTISLKHNAMANFIGLGYVTIISIVIFPLYLQYLGSEAYGLVGFFMVLQAWMQLLDMGMSPLLARQAARTRGQNIDNSNLRKLVRSFELIIFFLSITIVLVISTYSEWIASSWLNVISLDLKKVATSISFMGVIIGLRLFSSLYRSGIQGMENQVWLNVANIILVTFRYFGTLLLLKYVTQDIIHFFIFQLLVGIAELFVLLTMFYRSVPYKSKVGIGLFWDTLKPMLPFAGGIAYTAVLWVLLTQLDKLILSNILPLSDYGYFSLMAIVAAGIIQLSSPISQAILPRMTFLLSQGNEREMLELYRKSTQLMTVIMFPLAGMIALFSNELLYAWTGDKEAAEWAGPILYWFALGNGVLAVSAFQYYLQFAHGKLRLHIIYTSILVSVQIPIIIYTAFEYGALGVALTWFVLRLISFIIWTPVVHNVFAPGIHLRWLLKDVFPVLLSTAFLLVFFSSMEIDFERMSRKEILSTLFGIGSVILLVNIFVSTTSRELLSDFVKKVCGTK